MKKIALDIACEGKALGMTSTPVLANTVGTVQYFLVRRLNAKDRNYKSQYVVVTQAHSLTLGLNKFRT
jgi:hypothetical protein